MANATDFPQGYYNEAFYNGSGITCYPSSNATDDGKLNLEFNMARLVTRVTSKNFCITNPAYVITEHVNSETGLVDGLSISDGQCSINGMDLIMTESLFIGLPPNTNTDYYLVFKLWRDSSDNVLGDFTEGVTVLFKGVYLAYCESKDETDRDALYLGKVKYDGTNFIIEEDEDKYGRIWAEDILCKILDPKHPDNRRMLLQNWLYNVPDWYFSKEGDTIYGPLILADNRTNNNPGILMNVTEDNSTIVIKDPGSDNSNLYRYGDLNNSGTITSDDLVLIDNYINGTGTLTELQLILADVNGDGVVDEKDYQYIYDYINETPDVSYGKTGEIYFISSTTNGITYNVTNTRSELDFGASSIYIDDGDNYKLHIYSPNRIIEHSDEWLYLEGNTGVHIGAGGNADGPELILTGHRATIKDNNSTDLKFDLNFVSQDVIQQTLGKAIWQYDDATNYVSLLTNNVTLLDIKPNALFESNARIANTLTLGASNSTTTLNDTTWTLGSKNVQTATSHTITDEAAILTLQNAASPTANSILNSLGKLELRYNPAGASTTARITFGQNNTTANSDVILKKLNNVKGLDLNGELDVTKLVSSGEVEGSGLTTNNGTLTFKNGGSTAYISQNSGSAYLYTSDRLYIGSSGNKDLYANNITANNNVTVVGNYTSTNGNITCTNGVITGKKVYGAVYQDLAETYEKYEDEVIEDGDIVVIDLEGKVTKPQYTEDCKCVIGICSSNPGFILGSELYTEKTRCIVGIVGKLYVKTEDKYLRPGDKVKATVNGVVKVNIDNLEKDLPFVIGTVIEPYKNGKVRINFRPIL